jgi:hypothetical protein
MLITPHVLAGAAIVKKVRRPWLAYPAAFLSHFVLDYIPHLDSHGLFGVDGGPTTRLEIVSSAVDLVLAVTLLFWAISKKPNRGQLILGGFLGALVDIIYNVPPWNKLFHAWPVTSQIGEFHTWFQHRIDPSNWLLGFGTQALVIAVALFILLWKGKSKPRH